MAAQKSIRRQAVVLIHGIGEQRPMETLHSFVEALTAWVKGFDPKAERPRYWNRPDGVSEMYETRRITMEYFEGNPKTDFYEFYWAHHMRSTSFSHLVSWAWKLVTTPFSNVPRRLRPVLMTVWGLVVGGAALFLLVYRYRSTIASLVTEHLGLTVGALAFLGVLLRLVSWAVQNPFRTLLLNTAGDAARYFNPIPSNIEERSAIRREGIAFLKKLHFRAQKPYDRIIVVGHSLGSVVAYDMVRLLWHELHEQFTPSDKVDHTIFKEMNAECCKDPAGPLDIDAFQALQHQCFQQYRANGNPWLISDIITIAGAVAHADFYLLHQQPFSELVRQKEFPVCPPVMEGQDKTLFFDSLTTNVKKEGQDVECTVHFLNHAAPFALTRWTNIFFTSDYVGSEGQRIFGRGVRDIKLSRRSLWLLPGGHTRYWERSAQNEALSVIARAIGFSTAKKEPPKNNA